MELPIYKKCVCVWWGACYTTPLGYTLPNLDLKNTPAYINWFLPQISGREGLKGERLLSIQKDLRILSTNVWTLIES